MMAKLSDEDRMKSNNAIRNYLEDNGLSGIKSDESFTASIKIYKNNKQTNGFKCRINTRWYNYPNISKRIIEFENISKRDAQYNTFDTSETKIKYDDGQLIIKKSKLKIICDNDVED
jgi:hypothetical protein